MKAPPNFLIFMTDQQRADTAPPFRGAQMPALERFARESLAFSAAYTVSPHCCPSRASFFTGQLPTRHGVWNNVGVPNALSRGPRPGTRFFSDALLEAGYRLDFSGKWHVSAECRPEASGWNVPARQRGREMAAPRAETARAVWEAYRKLAAQPGGAPRKPGEIQRPGYPPYTHYGETENPFGDGDVVADALATFAERGSGSQPWCQFVGTLGPHDPYKVPRAFLDRYPAGSVRLPANFEDAMAEAPALYRRMRRVFAALPPEEHAEALRHYLALCSYEDFLFGQVLEALERSGQAENTVVLYCSDHGDYAGEHGLWTKGLPAYESAYHIPLLIRWPAGLQRPGEVCDRFVSLTDLAPTFLELAGCAPQPALDGRSLAPFLRGEDPADWRRESLRMSNGNELYGIQRSLRTERWKLVFNGFDEDELYDLATDPGETRNRAADPACAPIRRELYSRLWSQLAAAEDDCTNGYIAVGLAEYGPGVAFGGQ